VLLKHRILFNFEIASFSQR